MVGQHLQPWLLVRVCVNAVVRVCEGMNNASKVAAGGSDIFGSRDATAQVGGNDTALPDIADLPTSLVDLWIL
jgi:hypothetical protein